MHYMASKAAGLILMLVGLGFAVVSLTSRPVDLMDLVTSVLSFVAGYEMFLRTLRVVAANDASISLRGSGRTFAIARGDVLWAMQSGYPLTTHPLILLRLRRDDCWPMWVFVFDDPVYGVLFILRTWGVRGLGPADGT